MKGATAATTTISSNSSSSNNNVNNKHVPNAPGTHKELGSQVLF